MRRGQPLRINNYVSPQMEYGRFEEISNGFLSKGDYTIKFIQGFRADRDYKYCFKANRLEELLYF